MTEEPSSHQSGQSVRSGAVMVVGRALQLALQFGLGLVLMRLLEVEDFGVSALVFPLALLFQSITNGGLQSAIIQRDALHTADASALFWAALRWNAMWCALMAAGGVLLGVVYRDARPVIVCIAWAAIIFLATLSAIHEGMLKREFRFGAVLGAHLAALVVSIVVAIVAARMGARYWALILQMAVVELGRVALVWGICAWRPQPRSTLGTEPRDAVDAMRHYWRGLAGTRLLGWMAEQVDRLTVGIMGGAPLLGLYDAAKKYGTFAFVELHQPLTEVAVASLSRVRHDPDALRRYTKNTFAPILAVSIALLGFLATETEGVLQVLFGDKWLPAAVMMRALALGMMAASIGKLALWVSLSVGDTHRPLRWVTWTTPIIVASVVVGAQFGGEGVAMAIGATNILFAVPVVVFLLKPTAVRPREVIATWIVPVVAAAAGIVMLLVADDRLPSSRTLVGLVVRALAYGAVYLLVFVSQPGGWSMLRAMRPGSRP